MRFEIFQCPSPVRFPSGEFLISSPYYIGLGPGEYKPFDFQLGVFPDEDEAISIRVYPELFIKKGINIASYDLKNGILELVLHNVNPPRQATNVFQVMSPAGSISIQPNAPICFLSVLHKKLAIKSETS